MLLTVSGASFMVIESAGYYLLVYTSANLYMAWATAILSEVFQHALIIFTGSKKSQNIWFKSVAVGIFVLTVIAAGYKVYRPVLLSINEEKKIERVSRILEKEIEANVKDRDIFTSKGTKQRGNAAKSVIRRAKKTDELKDLIMGLDSGILSDIEVIHLFALRLFIQVASLLFSWKIGSVLKEFKSKSPLNNREHSGNRYPVRQWRLLFQRSIADFIGILEYNDGSFIATDSNEIHECKTLEEAREYFVGKNYSLPEKPKKVLSVNDIKLPKQRTA